VKIQIARVDNWEGLYLYGKLVMEGHSLRVEDVLAEIGLNAEVFWVDEEVFDGSSFPENVEDLPRCRL